MRRILLLAVSVATLAACQPPSSAPSGSTQSTTTAPTPAVVMCNEVTPDPTQARMPAALPPAAVAALSESLRGGPITPGTYDMTSGVLQGGAAGWTEARAVAINVADSDAGTVLNYAETRGAETARWTATLNDAPPSTLAFTCGRTGSAEVTYAASANELRITVPAETGAGAIYYVLAKRP